MTKWTARTRRVGAKFRRGAKKTPYRGAREVTDRMLDAACRAVVFARDRNRCARCGGTSHLQWAHVISRRYKCLRWSSRNSMVLCAGCHLRWHHQPVESAAWWVSWAGAETHDMLRSVLKSPGKLDRRLTLLYLQRELKALSNV